MWMCIVRVMQITSQFFEHAGCILHQFSFVCRTCVIEAICVNVCASMITILFSTVNFLLSRQNLYIRTSSRLSTSTSLLTLCWLQAELALCTLENALWVMLWCLRKCVPLVPILGLNQWRVNASLNEGARQRDHDTVTLNRRGNNDP